MDLPNATHLSEATTFFSPFFPSQIKSLYLKPLISDYFYRVTTFPGITRVWAVSLNCMVKTGFGLTARLSLYPWQSLQRPKRVITMHYSQELNWFKPWREFYKKWKNSFDGLQIKGGSPYKFKESVLSLSKGIRPRASRLGSTSPHQF